MRPTRLEIALGILIVALWIWALIWVHGLGHLRGPLADPSHSEKAAFLDELPPPPEP